VGCETASVGADRLESLSDGYEHAEAHYLMLVRAAADRDAHVARAYAGLLPDGTPATASPADPSSDGAER
jgi:hypothetical protein